MFLSNINLNALNTKVYMYHMAFSYVEYAEWKIRGVN
jgi:hypothetical protein